MNKIEAKKNLLRTMLVATLSIGLISQYKEVAYADEIVSSQNVDSLIPDNVKALLMNYCTIFNLDYNKVSELYYNHSLTLAGVSSLNEFNVVDSIQYESTEEAVLTFIYNIYFNSKDYGLNRKDLINGQNYEMQMSFEECISKYCDLLHIDKDIALSIAYAECGAPATSHNYLVNNNPAGIGPNIHFANKEVGIIYYAFLLRDSYGLTIESNEDFFRRVGKVYCTVGTDHWISMAKSFYSDVSDDYYFYNDEANTMHKQLSL